MDNIIQVATSKLPLPEISQHKHESFVVLINWIDLRTGIDSGISTEQSGPVAPGFVPPTDVHRMLYVEWAYNWMCEHKVPTIHYVPRY